MIKRIMAKAGVDDPRAVVKVGDTPNDIKEGRNASCGTVIGVLSGASDHDTLAEEKPDYILNNIYDIAAIE